MEHIWISEDMPLVSADGGIWFNGVFSSGASTDGEIYGIVPFVFACALYNY